MGTRVRVGAERVYPRNALQVGLTAPLMSGDADRAAFETASTPASTSRADFAKILVITHLEELKDAFSARIEVTKGTSGSQINVVAAPLLAFSPHVLMQIEAFGFCGRGEAKDFIAAGEIAIDGRLPVNTHGGLAGEGG